MLVSFVDLFKDQLLVLFSIVLLFPISLLSAPAFLVSFLPSSGVSLFFLFLAP